MKSILIVIALFFYCSQPLANDSEVNISENQWKLWKKHSSQSVSYRPITIAGKQLIEIRATATVNSTISGFLLFIQEVSNTPNWLVNASESKIIKRYSAKENSFYIKLTKIWPLKPRILMLHSTYWQNNDLSIEIKLTDVNSRLAEESLLLNNIQLADYLQVKTYGAHWKITPKSQVANDKSRYLAEKHQAEITIEYIFIADGRGDTPKWLADHLALKSIWKTMRNIRRQLPDKKWQQKSIEGITELVLLNEQ